MKSEDRPWRPGWWPLMAIYLVALINWLIFPVLRFTSYAANAYVLLLVTLMPVLAMLVGFRLKGFAKRALGIGIPLLLTVPNFLIAFFILAELPRRHAGENVRFEPQATHEVGNTRVVVYRTNCCGAVGSFGLEVREERTILGLVTLGRILVANGRWHGETVEVLSADSVLIHAEGRNPFPVRIGRFPF